MDRAHTKPCCKPTTLGPARAVGVCLALSCAFSSAPSSLLAQPPNRPRPTGGLQALEPGMQDLDPLRTSLRLQPVDLRQPMDFDKVYRLPGSGATDRLVRMSGAVSAVFPRSDYVGSENGLLALIPAGTVFHLGGVPGTEPASAPRQVAPGSAAALFDGRDVRFAPVEMTLRVDGRDVSEPQVIVNKDFVSQSRSVAIMSDERYRGARVRQLLETAAATTPTRR